MNPLKGINARTTLISVFLRLRENIVGTMGSRASHLRIKKCPYCHSSDVRLSHRKNLVEFALSFLGIYPFRCESCNGRFRKLYGRHLV